MNPNIPVRYGASYNSIALLAANTPEVVFLPGSNVNGAIVWEASHMHNVASGSSNASFVAKTSAPTTVIDGDVVCGINSLSGGSVCGKTLRPIFIPAGKGLYYITTVAGSVQNLRNVLYTLL